MPIDLGQQEKYIAIWAKSIDTQMHFNEMCVKSRQLGLTFVAAALGVGVVLLGRGADFAFFLDLGGLEFQLHISVILLLGACLALYAVKGLDLNVYRRMLRGAVTFGEDFEENYMKQIFDLDKGMTQAISHYSRFDDADREISPAGRYVYSGSFERNAEEKIKRFYGRTMMFLVFSALFLLFTTNVAEWLREDPSMQETEIQPEEVK